MSLTPELRRFLDKSERLLAVADELFKTHHLESCISRAYYALFVAVSVLLEAGARQRRYRYIDKVGNLGWRIKAKHETVHADFLTHFVKPGYFTNDDGKTYGKLKVARETADYGLESYTTKDVEVLLKQAKVLIDKVRRSIP